MKRFNVSTAPIPKKPWRWWKTTSTGMTVLCVKKMPKKWLGDCKWAYPSFCSMPIDSVESVVFYWPSVPSFDEIFSERKTSVWKHRRSIPSKWSWHSKSFYTWMVSHPRCRCHHSYLRHFLSSSRRILHEIILGTRHRSILREERAGSTAFADSVRQSVLSMLLPGVSLEEGSAMDSGGLCLQFDVSIRQRLHDLSQSSSGDNSSHRESQRRSFRSISI